MQRTLILIKPDAVQRGLIGNIITRFEQRGLKIVAMKMIYMNEKLARRHYAVHEGKDFFAGLVKFITSGPIVAAVLEGDDAVEIVRKTMGSTDPLTAPPGTIRADFGIDMGRNLVHGSDSPENATQEIALFFAPEEVLSYQRALDEWITGP